MAVAALVRACTAPMYAPRAGSSLATANSIAPSSSSKCGRANGMVRPAP